MANGTLDVELTSVYVGVEDVNRALDFNRELFEREPTQAEERFSTFAFGDVNFGLYNAGYDGYDVDFGDNCVPNFEVDDVEAAYERIEAIAPAMVHDDVMAIGDYRTFHFRDTEGNAIEVFGIESA